MVANPMRTVLFHPRILPGLGLMLAAAGGMHGAALDLGSPFLPSSGVAAAAPTASAPIELHGYMVTPAGEAFSIYDPSKKSAAWVKVNETGYPFVVRSHKTVNSTDEVTVDYQGSTLTLALKPSKIASAAQAGGMGAIPGFAGRAGGGFGGARGGGPPGRAATPTVPTAEEATRLQAAAADFQQRQAQRQQAQAVLQAQQAVAPIVPAAPVPGQRGQGGGGGGRRAQRNAQ
jgi:hypothetical protein